MISGTSCNHPEPLIVFQDKLDRGLLPDVLFRGRVPTDGPLGGGERTVDDLRLRAQRFLERPFPFAEYNAGNLTDGFIHRYSVEGPWSSEDTELHDLVRLCYVLARSEVEQHSGEAQAYYQECSAVLRDIALEIYGPKALE